MLRATSRHARRLLSVEGILQGTTVVIVSILVIGPLSWVVLKSLQGTDGNITIDNFTTVLSSPWFFEVMYNTFTLALSQSLLALFLGTTLAWIASRTNTPGRKVINLVAITNIFIAPLASALAWSILAARRTGLINVFMQKLFGVSLVININSFEGMVFLGALVQTPVVYVLVSSALQSMDYALEEQARIAGASVLRTTISVTLPLVKPALLSAFMLVFILGMEGFAIPLVLGWPIGYYVITTKIYALVSFPPARYGAASTLAVITLIIGGALVWMSRKSMARGVYRTVTPRGYRPGVVDLGYFRFVTLAFCGIVLFLSTVLPYVALLLGGFLGPDGSLTLKNVQWALRQMMFWPSISNALLVGLIGATVGMLLAMVAAWIICRTNIRGRGALEYLTSVPLAVPGIVMSLGMLLMGLTPPFLLFYGTIWILIFANIARFIPYGMRSMLSTLVQIDKELEESGRMCGGSWLHTIRTITLPLLKPGFAGGWILLFVTFFRQISSIMFLWTSKTITLPILIFEQWYDGWQANFAILCLAQAAILLSVRLVFNIVFKVKVTQERSE